MSIGAITRCRTALLAGLVVLTVSCGGGSTGTPTPAGDSAATDEAKAVTDAQKAVSTILKVGGSLLGREDAPGKVRFGNFLTSGGPSTDVDVWWGLPDDREKAATVKLGELSPYLTPRRVKGSDSVMFTVTATASNEVLWMWDRLSPTKATQQTVLWHFEDGEFFQNSLNESLTEVFSSEGIPDLPEPDNGKVRLRWFVLGTAIEMDDRLLVVTSGGKCLTNGTGIADDSGDMVIGVETMQATPSSVLSLAPACDGPAASEPVTVPDRGRAHLFAYRDGANKPVLRLLPVPDAP
jgi:hypothetical protein